MGVNGGRAQMGHGEQLGLMERNKGRPPDALLYGPKVKYNALNDLDWIRARLGRQPPLLLHVLSVTM